MTTRSSAAMNLQVDPCDITAVSSSQEATGNRLTTMVLRAGKHKEPSGVLVDRTNWKKTKISNNNRPGKVGDNICSDQSDGSDVRDLSRRVKTLEDLVEAKKDAAGVDQDTLVKTIISQLVDKAIPTNEAGYILTVDDQIKVKE